MSPRTNKSQEDHRKEILEYFKEYYLEYQDYPTYDQIAHAVDIKSKGGHLKPILDQMLEEGLLEKVPGGKRGVRLPRQGLVSIPFKGVIAADNINPEMLLDHDPHEDIDLFTELLPKRRGNSQLYALKVRGDSMEEALIGNGDTIIMEEGDRWNEGDIVAIWLVNEGATTLKEIRSAREGTVNLIAKSHKHHSRTENLTDIKVMGRLVAVVRRYAKPA